MTVKMPEPMTAPMPRAVSDQGPRVFLRACSGSSDSRISLSMDLRANSWLGRVVLLLLRYRKAGSGKQRAFAAVYRMRESGGEAPAGVRGEEWAGRKRAAEPVREARQEREERTAGQPWRPARGTAKLPFGSRLALGDSANQLLHLLLVGAAGSCPFGLGGGLFAGHALHSFPFLTVFDFGGICHCYPLSLESVLPGPTSGTA